MLRNQMPTDELAHICGEIRELRVREVEMRKCFTEDGQDALYEGCDFDVEVIIQKRRVLNKDRLPAHILNDPKYFDVKYSPVVKVVARKQVQMPFGFLNGGRPLDTDRFEVVEACS